MFGSKHTEIGFSVSVAQDGVGRIMASDDQNARQEVVDRAHDIAEEACLDCNYPKDGVAGCVVTINPDDLSDYSVVIKDGEPMEINLSREGGEDLY